MQIGVSFVLRASTAAFKEGLASANNSIKGLKKSLTEFNVGGGLRSLLGVGGAIAGFRAMVNGAQEMRAEFEKMGKAIPESVRSVAELGDSVDSLKRGILELSVTSLSYVTRFGEGIGSLINRLRGVSAEQEKIREASARAADQEERQLAAAMERDKSVRADAERRLQNASTARMTDKEKFDAATSEAASIEKELKGVLPGTTRELVLRARQKELQNFFAEADDADTKRGMKEAENTTKLAEAAAAEAERIKRNRLNKVAPTVEELAAQETGGFVAGDDPRLRARQTLQLEERARILGQRGDIKGALDLQSKADQMRAGLENATATSQVLTPQTAKTAFEEALTKTNEELAAVKDALGGLIKAQP